MIFISFFLNEIYNGLSKKKQKKHLLNVVVPGCLSVKDDKRISCRIILISDGSESGDAKRGEEMFACCCCPGYKRECGVGPVTGGRGRSGEGQDPDDDTSPKPCRC